MVPDTAGNGLPHKLTGPLSTIPVNNSAQAAPLSTNAVDPRLADADAAGPSTVTVDMESADVRAERDRVAALSSFEDQCIVMQDLRKVYPPQVDFFSCFGSLQVS